MLSHPLIRFPARLLTIFILIAGVMTCPGLTAAQEQMPRDHRRDHARQKAERFSALALADQAQTANQDDYDVTYYELDLDMDPVTSIVSGSVTVTGEITGPSLSTIDLNLLDNMSVSQVAWSGGSYAFSHSSDILTVTLDRTYVTDEVFEFTVFYSGTPDPAWDAFGFDTYNGEPMIWSLSEPYGARSWWPCKDVPSDKADSVDIHITVPSDLIVASNGNLISETINGSDKTYHWSERYPITTYLVSVAIHPYTVYSDWYVYSPTDSMEVQYYVFPDKYEAMQSVYGMTVEMIEVFSSLFGEYPFINEKYGHAHFLWGGGMEHQTCSSLYYAIAHEYLNVHELAHMWWGDMITCDSFHHIWLNEGFAVYSEALWSQEKYGVAKYHQDMENTKYFGGGTIFVPNPDDFSRIFNVGLSYNKASWVPHMLRHIVGDATFYDILTTYYADTRYQYGTATTEEFRDLCEDVAGIDLDWFFHQWIYEEYYPQYEYNWSSAPNGGLYDVSLTIDQVQTNYIFKMPIDVTVTTTAGDTTFVVWDSLATQAFTLTVDSPPIQVALDKDDWILCTIEEPVIDPTFHRGILVVNGVDFDTYGSAIWSAYADSAFWGSYDMSFWDCFEETGSGYPANVPTPLGHGPIPADTLKEFSTVVWVGNNYNGDLPKWTDTAIQSYLQAGGNVLLMSRMGRDFVDEDLRSYLGITWREFPENTLNNCVATYPGLVDMTLAGGTQTYCAVFDTSLATSESTLLFKETASFSTHRGLGAIRIPVGGGTDREDGGRFAFLSGRPYRWNHDALRANVEFMLGSLLNEPYVPTGIEPPATPKAALRLEQNHPNPFNPETTIRYTVPTGGLVDMKIYDVSGRLVRTLVSRELPAGEHSVLWDGKNTGGESVASGVYFYRMIAGGQAVTKKMVMLR